MSEVLQVPWVWYPSVVIGFALWTAAYMLFVSPLHREGCRRSGSPAGLSRWHPHRPAQPGFSNRRSGGRAPLQRAHAAAPAAHVRCGAPVAARSCPRCRRLGLDCRPPSAPWPARASRRPPSAWVVFAGVMWIWHVPQLFELSLHFEALHVLEHLTFIGGGLIGWWPIVAPSALGAAEAAAAGSHALHILRRPGVHGRWARCSRSLRALYPSYARVARHPWPLRHRPISAWAGC